MGAPLCAGQTREQAHIKSYQKKEEAGGNETAHAWHLPAFNWVLAIADGVFFKFALSIPDFECRPGVYGTGSCIAGCCSSLPFSKTDWFKDQ